MEYVIKNNQMRVYGCGGGNEFDRNTNQWTHYTVLCNVNKPIGIYATSNNDDITRKQVARQIKGARLLYSWERGNFIDDPYGKAYKIGIITCEIWDFREVLGKEKEPIENFIDFETKEFLKNIVVLK